jgi:hypothetical protein
MGNLVNQPTEHTSAPGPEASACGRTNAHYHSCEIVGQMRNYATCIARLEDRLAGDPACLSAIAKSGCPASAMRAKELAQGVALYFEERTRVASFVTDAEPHLAHFSRRSRRSTSEGKPAESAPAPMPTPAPDRGLLAAAKAGSALTFASAINAITEGQPKTPTPTKAPTKAQPEPKPVQAKPVVKLDIRPGESPLEAARRRSQTQAAAASRNAEGAPK